MKRNTIVEAVIAAALAQMQVKTEPEPKPSEKEQAIQAFFDGRPFDCQLENAAKLVGLLTGYTPHTGAIKNRPGLFEIWMYNGQPVLTVSIKANPNYSYGITVGCNANFYFEGTSTSKRIPPEEQKTHLKSFAEAWTDEKLLSWLSGMGRPYLSEFINAVENGN